MKVYSLAIPTAEPMNGERVPEVIWPGADTALARLQPGQNKQTAERATGSLNGQDPLIGTDEETRLWAGGSALHSDCKISVQLPAQRAMEGNPSCAPFEGLDEENTGSCIHIAHAQAKRFSKSDAGAVKDEQQSSVEV